MDKSTTSEQALLQKSFPEMRRKDRQLSDAKARDILQNGRYGVLSTVDADGQPYGVPISYAYDEAAGVIYLHCAREGHKLTNIRSNNRVSFCVVNDASVHTLPAIFSTEYQSTIVTGTIKELEGDPKSAGLFTIIEKYAPDYLEEGREYIKKLFPATILLCLTIDRITGKGRLPQ